MSDRVTIEQFANMSPSVQQFMIDHDLAPIGVGAQPATVAPVQTTVAPQTPPAQPAGALPSLDEIPDQSRQGADFFPFAEFDCVCMLDQVQHRVGQECGPNYYAQFSVQTVDEMGMRAGIAPNSSRSTMWKYNMNTFGEQRRTSDRSVARYKQFVRQVCGLPEGAKVDAQSAQLLADSARMPSLGRKVRVISTRGNERKNAPGTYFYNVTVIPLS